MQSTLTRLLSVWVKPDVVPENARQLINPDIPLLYVLEYGRVADVAALTIVARRLAWPAPSAALVFGDMRERSSIDVLQQRRGGLFKKHRHVVSKRLTRLVQAGLDDNAGELQIVPVAIYWGRTYSGQADHLFWSKVIPAQS